MRHAIATVLSSTLVLSSTTALAEGFKPGDKVVAMRGRTNSFFAATVKTASDDGGSVTFADGTEQQYGPITFEPSLRAFDWKVGSQLECGADAKTAATVGDEAADALTHGAVTAIDATTVELDKKAKFPLAGCRYHRTWWDEVSVYWREYAKYKTIAAFPKAGAKAPSGDEIRAAFSDYLSGADGGSYIVIKQCVATAKGWVKLNSGDEHTARTIDVACGVALPLPPKPRENFTCLVQYGTCRQPYQGDGVYGGCEWHNVTRDPDQIKCAMLK
jgi:hypothetical protein